MEYEKKKVQILEKVEYTNLLSFSLVQNKLEQNFRRIVEALMLNQAKTDGLKQSHNTLNQQHVKQTSEIKGQLQEIMKQIQNLKSLQKNSPKTLQSVKQLSQNELQKLSMKNINDKKLLNTEQNTQKQLIDLLNKRIKGMQNKWQNDKNSLKDQIKDLKDKLESIGDLKNQFNDFKVDLKMVQDDLISTIKNNSNKPSSKNMIKRESILNMVANKNTQRVIQKSKPQLQNQQKSKKQINDPSKLSRKSLINQENKQNNLTQDKNLQTSQQQIFNQNLDKQINSIYLELNTLKISFQELKDMLSDNKKQTYKNNNLLSQAKEDLVRQVKTRKSQTQDIYKQIKDMKMQMMNLQNTESSNQKGQAQDKNDVKQFSGKTKKTIKEDQDGNVNYKNHLNDKMSRMQAMIHNFITQSQFNRFKSDVNDQLEKIWAKLENDEQNIDLIDKKYENIMVQNNSITNQLYAQLKNSILAMDQNIKNEASQNERKHNINQARVQQLKKSLQNLRQDLQFYQSLMNENNNANKEQKNSSQNNPNSPLLNNKNNANNLDQKDLQALKTYFTGKMHDLRTNLLGSIRDLEKKLNNKSNGEQQIIKIWDKINQIKLFMNKKADQDDTKKTFLYVEKKINRLNNLLFKNQDNTQDARIARSNNWNCLSCDKNLESYKGKIGRHIVWDSMPLKGINKSVLGLQNYESKKSLPQLKK